MRTALAALLVAAALPLGGAEATHFLDPLAHELVEECSFDSVAQQDVTGGTYEGAAWGHAVRGADDEVAISCVIKVDGVPAARVDGDTSRGVAVAAGQIRFEAADTSYVQLCWVVTVNGVATETCPGLTYWPPEDFSKIQPFLDHVNEAMVQADGVYCPVLGAHAGTYGPVTVDGGGDVYYDGELFWDCHPWADA